MKQRLWIVVVVLLAALLCAALARADEEDEAVTLDDEDPGRAYEEAEEASEEVPRGPSSGLATALLFTPYADLKVPAGERVETLIAVRNAGTNGDLTAVFAMGHLSPLGDYERFYQNFSGNAYDRKLPSGETTTIKYSFTPDVNAEPQQFALVLRLFVQQPDDANSTFVITVFNGTITIEEPLGVDPKSVFTVLLFGAIAAGAVFYYFSRHGTASSTRRAAPAMQKQQEIGGVTVNPDYVHASHLKGIEKRTRSLTK